VSADGIEFDPSGRRGSAHARPSADAPPNSPLDPQLARIVADINELTARILAAQPGVLGASATGLLGDTDQNMAALVRATQQLEAASTIAGTKADAADESWRGMRSTLRAMGKVSAPEMAAALRAGSLASDYPEVGAAWANGDISSAQMRHIARTVNKVPYEFREASVTILADYAPGSSFRELVHATKRLLKLVCPRQAEKELEYNEDKVHFSLYDDGVGYRAEGWFTYEQGGWLQAMLDAYTVVTATDETRTRSGRQGDAIITMVRQFCDSDGVPSIAMAKPRLIVLTTLADLQAIAADAESGDLPMTVNGHTLDSVTTRRLMSEADVVPVVADDACTQIVADIALDPKTASAIRAREALFAKANRRSRTDRPRGAPPMLFRLLTTPVRPLALGRSQRIVPGWLRDAVTLRDRHCVVPGCEVVPQRCEVHHVVPWANGGATDLPNLALLCLRHHRKVEVGTWRLRPREEGDGPGRYWLAESVWG
jgi:hypothetical protein